MELRDYAKVILRWWWLIVLGVVVALVPTYLSVRKQPPTYEATATLLVGQTMQQQQPDVSELWTEQQLATTYSDMASRRLIQDATMKALNLTWLPPYTANPIPNTQLLEIRVVDTDPERAAAVANEIAEQLISSTPASQAKQDSHQAFIQQQLADLEASINATKDEIARQQLALAGLFSAREISDAQNQIAALRQKLITDQSTYGQLYASSGQGSVNTLTKIDPAVAPQSPTGPSKTRTLLMAGAVGLVLAVGTAFLLEYLDDTIKTPEDVDKATGLTTLAGISRIPGESAEQKLVTVKHPKSAISEAYRVLRTNLQFSSLDKPLRALVVTSPNPVEGKSTTVANLGVVMAQAGKRVILVDADLRKPVLHRIFGVENYGGLTETLLQPDPNLDGHLQPTGVENLRLLNTGPLPPNPSELLGSQKMATLINRLKDEADIILFDSPPSLAVADAAVLATQADGVLVVTDAGHTRRSIAKEAVKRLRQVGANPVGVALNRLRAGQGGYYYHYYYHYYHDQDGQRHRQRSDLGRRLRRLFRRSAS